MKLTGYTAGPMPRLLVPLACLLIAYSGGIRAQDATPTPKPRHTSKTGSQTISKTSHKSTAQPSSKAKSRSTSDDDEPDATPRPKRKPTPEPDADATPKPDTEATSESTPQATPKKTSETTAPSKRSSVPTYVTPLDPSEISDFDQNPPAVRRLLEAALALTKQHLGYKFGSSDPAEGGMDCSGTIFHVLRSVGIEDVPRTASDQYVWARKADEFEAVVSRRKDSFELDDLHPGDLLFWTGTYTTDRDPPVTHTMIYVGKLKSDGRQVMFGASDGRTYGGNKMWGVSAFDFTIPKAKERPAAGQVVAPGSVFIGYASIPGLEGNDDRSKTKGTSSEVESSSAGANDSPATERKPAESSDRPPAKRQSPDSEESPPSESLRSQAKEPEASLKSSSATAKESSKQGSSTKHRANSDDDSAAPDATPRKKKVSHDK